MPAIVDLEGPGGKPFAIFESGAILMYLAEKFGKLMPTETRGKYEVIEWLMVQMASVGPMLGQAHHFRLYAPEKLQYAIDRYTNEARRIYNVIDKRLGEAAYLAGEYSIADIAVYPWLVPHDLQGQNLDDTPSLKRWYEEMRNRPAVQRGFAVMADEVAKMREAAAARQRPHDQESWNNLFGNRQFEKREGRSPELRSSSESERR